MRPKADVRPATLHFCVHALADTPATNAERICAMIVLKSIETERGEGAVIAMRWTTVHLIRDYGDSALNSAALARVYGTMHLIHFAIRKSRPIN